MHLICTPHTLFCFFFFSVMNLGDCFISVPTMHHSFNCTVFYVISFLLGACRLFPVFAIISTTYLVIQPTLSQCLPCARLCSEYSWTYIVSCMCKQVRGTAILLLFSCPWANYFTFLSVSFFIDNMGIILHRVVERRK